MSIQKTIIGRGETNSYPTTRVGTLATTPAGSPDSFAECRSQTALGCLAEGFVDGFLAGITSPLWLLSGCSDSPTFGAFIPLEDSQGKDTVEDAMTSADSKQMDPADTGPDVKSADIPNNLVTADATDTVDIIDTVDTVDVINTGDIIDTNPPKVNHIPGYQLKTLPLGILPNGDQCFKSGNSVPLSIMVLDLDNDPLTLSATIYHAAQKVETVTAMFDYKTYSKGTVNLQFPANLLKPRTDYCGNFTIDDGVGNTVNTNQFCFTTSEKGLIGWWRFDEGQGNIVKDSSGKNVDGILMDFDDPNKAWVKTPTGGGLFFDGVKNYIQTSSPASWDKLNFVSASVTFSNAFPLDNHAVLIDKLGEGSKRLAFEFFPDKTLLFGSCAQNVNCVIGNIPQPTFPFNDTNWHTAFGVYDGTTSQLLVDNDHKSTVTYNPAGGPIMTKEKFLIGRWTAGGRFYHGTIDEVRLYDLDITTQCK